MAKENIKKTLTQLFTANVGLKLLSLLIAFFLWFAVVNYNDPVVPSTYRNVPVKIINREVIEDAGKTMEVLDGTDYVSSIVIKAPRSIISELNNSNSALTVIADMKNLSGDETMVPIEVSTVKYSDKIENIKLSSDTLKVNIEARKSIQLPIQATTSGEVEPGYVIGSVVKEQNQVRVSGPQSIVSTIKMAVVDVQVSGFTEKISTAADIILYDENGEAVPTENLDLNAYTVKVDVDILATKKVPVTFAYTGTTAEGYEATGEISADVEEIIIAGPEKRLEYINAVNVPDSALNITGLSSTLRAVINIGDYLPNGIVVSDSSNNGLVNVAVYIEPLRTESYSVILKNIEVLNLPVGFSKTEWAEDEDYVKFTVSGLSQNIEKIQLGQLNFSVDFTDYQVKEGDPALKDGSIVELPLHMELPEEVNVEDVVMVKVKLKK